MQRDHHAELGELLLRAETAPDELERLLSVSRIVMRLILDVMRPGASYGDTPMVILGQHSMSHRILADKYRGDELWLFLQEIVSHDSVDRPILLENKRRGPEIARFSMRITPVASVQPRIRSQRSALAWPAGSSGPPELHVALTVREYVARGHILPDTAMALTTAIHPVQGDGRVRLTQHSDAYSFTLPMLRFSEALTNSASIELTGSCSVRCGATGLMLTMKFKEGRVVKGTIVRIQGNEDIPIAKLVGNWDEDIIVESIAMDAAGEMRRNFRRIASPIFSPTPRNLPPFPNAGTLMSASEFQPPLQTTINLAQPGPRQMMRLWSGILESMNFVDASQVPLVKIWDSPLRDFYYYQDSQRSPSLQDPFSPNAGNLSWRER